MHCCRKASAFLLVLMLAAPGARAQQAAKIHMHADSGYAADGQLFQPQGPGPFEALLLVHDEWGVTDRVIAQAKGFADAGYVVVAIDLYRGEIPTDSAQAARLDIELTDERAQHDLMAAMTFLASQPNVRSGHIAAVGWSTAAARVLKLAAAESRPRAVVVYACEPPAMAARTNALTVSVLGIFGGCGRRTSPHAVEAFEKSLRARGATVSTTIYPRAANRTEANGPNRQHLDALEARDAKSRTLGFLTSALADRSHLD